MRLITVGSCCLVMLATITPTRAAPSLLNSTVVGGSGAQAPNPSWCERDFDKSATGVWLRKLVSGLCKRGDAESLLAVFVLTAPGFGSHGAPDMATLDRAYVQAKSDPVVFWAAALLSDCRIPWSAGQCKRMLASAKKLVQVDSDNAMAWLTLAYASDASLAKPNELSAALEHAVAAPRLHDYGFDLLRLSATASGGLPTPQSVLTSQQTPEQFRLELTSAAYTVIPTHFVVDWLKQGCNAAHADPPPAAVACTKAEALLSRGDSAATLSENVGALAEITSNLRHAVAPFEHADVAAAILAAYAESSNERDYAANIAKRFKTP